MRARRTRPTPELPDPASQGLIIQLSWQLHPFFLSFPRQVYPFFLSLPSPPCSAVNPTSDNLTEQKTPEGSAVRLSLEGQARVSRTFQAEARQIKSLETKVGASRPEWGQGAARMKGRQKMGCWRGFEASSWGTLSIKLRSWLLIQ